MNVDIEEASKSCPVYLDYWDKVPREKVMSHKLPDRPYKSVRADMFTANNKHYLCKKKVEEFSTDNLIKHEGVFFSEYRLSRKTVSEAYTKFLSGVLKKFCKYLNIQHAVSSSYNHQSNGQADNEKLTWNLCLHICGFITDWINTNKSKTTKPSY